MLFEAKVMKLSIKYVNWFLVIKKFVLTTKFLLNIEKPHKLCYSDTLPLVQILTCLLSLILNETYG